jgi:mRNA interferase RelE/StbE
LPWAIEIGPVAQRQFDKLDRSTAIRLQRYLNERVAPLDDARQRGEPLYGPQFGQLWRYRDGDYRIIRRIEDQRLVWSWFQSVTAGKFYRHA